MSLAEGSVTVEFHTARQVSQVSVARLEDAATEFLELYAEPPLVPTTFRSLIGDGDGETRFAKLLHAAGFGGDPDAFFAAVGEQLGDAAGGTADIAVGGVVLPYRFLLAMLEVVIPGDEVHGVKTVRRLERLTNIEVPKQDRAALREVLDRYPVRLSSHVIRQMRLSSDVAYQYLPATEELQPDGLVHTWVGQFHRGVVEQMYRDRVIFVLNMSCPVYCRYCFRKHKECRTQRPPSQKHVDLGVSYIKSCPEIKEVVLTGGDPFMNRATLTRAIDGLGTVPHVETLRVATRSVAYHPSLFTARDDFWLDYLKRKKLELRQRGTNIELATHFIHPDEISVSTLDLITELVGSGIPVYVQTPFLGGCNESGEILTDLFGQLRAAGAEIHYIFLPCSPIQGNARYRAPISAALDAARYLRANLSDRAMPHLCTATAIGKMDWGTSGWAVEVDQEDDRFLWIRTPYGYEYYETFAPILDLSRVARPNSEGTLDARFMADIGDPELLLGPRESADLGRAYLESERYPEVLARDVLTQLQEVARTQLASGSSLVATKSPSFVRVHTTRVELDCDAEEALISDALRNINDDHRISDVVLLFRKDVVRSLHRLTEVVEALQSVPHVTAVRLRTASMYQRPEVFSDGVIRRLGALNRLTVVHPTRLELETCILHSSEITPEHARVVRSLRQRGVTVYCDIPLLRFVNDGDGELTSLTDACRRIGIEVHNLYLAGHPIQADWSLEHPVYASQIVDLATRLRTSCSGRQLPFLVIRTALGEVDFGLTGIVVGEDDEGWAKVKLLAYPVDARREIAPGIPVPDAVEIDPDGHPIVTVPGLVA
jgi:L-lysine 2,3-aminomutase